MDYSRGFRSLKETTYEVGNSWLSVFNSIKNTKGYILFVLIGSNILYIIVSLLYRLFSYRRNL